MKLGTTRARMLTIAGIGVSAVVVIGGTATAASQITAHQLATGSVNSRVVKDGSLRTRDLTAHVNALLHKGGTPGPRGARGPQGPAGKDGISGVQADVPYGQDVLPNPGLPQSNDTIPAGATQSVWVECHGSSLQAVGGGFILGGGGDYVNGGTDLPGVDILSSLPAYVENGALSTNAPITDPAVGSFRPNAWAVSVHNGSASDVVVRPSVVCAAVPSGS